jgi:hypothetical protein
MSTLQPTTVGCGPPYHDCDPHRPSSPRLRYISLLHPTSSSGSSSIPRPQMAANLQPHDPSFARRSLQPTSRRALGAPPAPRHICARLQPQQTRSLQATTTARQPSVLLHAHDARKLDLPPAHNDLSPLPPSHHPDRLQPTTTRSASTGTNSRIAPPSRHPDSARSPGS